jgi:peptidoglycan/LPS O-acetylase OafA/YrhL
LFRYFHIDPVGFVPILITLLPALLVVYLLSKVFPPKSIEPKYGSIDGLRGFLAFFVFLYHSSVLYFCYKGSAWGPPPSRLFSHFGQSSVSLFFMITSFLFFQKLIDGKNTPIDWTKLFLSRLLRLFPVYLIAFLILLFCVGYLSNFTLKEGIGKVFANSMQWLFFTIISEPNINAVRETKSMLFGVLWSVRYEWLFYFSLPIIALVFLGIEFRSSFC